MKRTIVIIWILSYLAPLFLFFTPQLGLPARSHNARIFQIVVAVMLTIWTTLWNLWLYRREQRRQRTISAIRSRGYTVAVLLCLCVSVATLPGCAIRRASAPSQQVTALEQVMTWNAALADSNLAIAKGVIAASDAQEIDVPTANRILTAQSLIADADRQLTPILAKACSPQKQIQACNPAILSGDSAAIENFLDQIKASAKGLVSTPAGQAGAASIKNPQRREAVQAAIDAIYALADNIAAALKSLGVLK
jgi:hypothetical protein